MDLLINIDVPDLARAIAFYTEAFGLTVTRRLGDGTAELGGLPVRIYLLEKPEGTIGAAKDPRRYDRHWTPVHVDVIVDDVEAAVTRAVAAGARIETDIRTEAYGKIAILSEAYGKIAILSDPFGHGFCLIQFHGLGYDEIAETEAR
jgi:predicted enzyme related to lactoylglutathione lyase